MAFRTQRATNRSAGFTLIELLVVIGILGILLAITIIALNPTKHFRDARDAQRRSDVAAILDAIYEYQAANSGGLPSSVSGVTSAVHLGKGSGLIDTCTDLVPTYVADLPKDPKTGTVTGGNTPCAAGVSAYDTGYTIALSSGRFTIAAPDAEGGSAISVTR